LALLLTTLRAFLAMVEVANNNQPDDIRSQ